MNQQFKTQTINGYHVRIEHRQEHVPLDVYLLNYVFKVLDSQHLIFKTFCVKTLEEYLHHLHICTVGELKQYYYEYCLVSLMYCIHVLKSEYFHLKEHEVEKVLPIIVDCCCEGMKNYDRNALKKPRNLKLKSCLNTVVQMMHERMKECSHERKKCKNSGPYYYDMISTQNNHNLDTHLERVGNEIMDGMGSFVTDTMFDFGMTPTPFNENARFIMENELDLSKWIETSKTIVIYDCANRRSEVIKHMNLCGDHIVVKKSKSIRIILPLGRELVTMKGVTVPFDEYWSKDYNIHFIVYSSGK